MAVQVLLLSDELKLDEILSLLCILSGYDEVPQSPCCD
jgi:hypothetical protein